MSASTRLGRSARAICTASLSVEAIPTTLWPHRSTRSWMSRAMIGSSSMMSTRAAALARSPSRAARNSRSATSISSRQAAAAAARGCSSSAVSSSSMRCSRGIPSPDRGRSRGVRRRAAHIVADREIERGAGARVARARRQVGHRGAQGRGDDRVSPLLAAEERAGVAPRIRQGAQEAVRSGPLITFSFILRLAHARGSPASR